MAGSMLLNILMALLAAFFFVVVGVRLLLLSRRTGEIPERLLGIYFAATGLAYVGWQIPMMLKIDATGGPVDLAAWTLYAIGVVPFLMFVRKVFRPDANWAKALVGVSAAALISGMAMCISQGNNYYHIDNPWYWCLWFGYTTPCVWMSIEAFRSYANANRRVRVGLCDRITANRYLLFGCFAAFQIFACVTDLFLTVGITTDASNGLNSLLALLEMAGLVVLFLAFFPPLSYERWIEAAAPAGTGTSEA